MIDMKKLKLFLFDKKQYVPSKANQRAETWKHKEKKRVSKGLPKRKYRAKENIQ
jgi:hypothetical protein